MCTGMSVDLSVGRCFDSFILHLLLRLGQVLLSFVFFTVLLYELVECYM